MSQSYLFKRKRVHNIERSVQLKLASRTAKDKVALSYKTLIYIRQVFSRFTNWHIMLYFCISRLSWKIRQQNIFYLLHSKNRKSFNRFDKRILFIPLYDDGYNGGWSPFHQFFFYINQLNIDWNHKKPSFQVRTILTCFLIIPNPLLGLLFIITWHLYRLQALLPKLTVYSYKEWY